MKVAIVGSGIAGLSAAWLLGRQHEVTLFERHARPGMGAFNLAYQDKTAAVRIDVPLRAFNTCYYRNLVALYKEVGVDMLRADHSASYTSAKDGRAYFGYRYLGIGDRSLPVLAGFNKLGLKSALILKDMSVFLLTAPRDRASGKATGLSIDEYLRTSGYSKPFIDEVILPTFAAICTCSYQAVKQYPAELIIDFLAGGLLFNGIWRARHGADDAIERMLAHCKNLECNADIERIYQHQGRVHVRQHHGQEQVFDHVIVATQANQALRLVTEDEAKARRLLKKIPYEKSDVVVHGDVAAVPNHERERAPVQFLVDAEQGRPMASIWLNKIYPALKRSPPLFQTWNPILEPDENKVLGRFQFERPVVNAASLAALESLRQLHREPNRRIWYCGSYAMPGIPLQESAVQSAMEIATHLGVAVPWLAKQEEMPVAAPRLATT